MIAIVDYGAGNLASVCKAFAAIGSAARVAHQVEDLVGCEAIVVPGVGHFGATAALGAGWRGAIHAHAHAGRPLLGICLGMQWLFDASTEAPACPGLGLLTGTCSRLEAGTGAGKVKVPHVGWNALEACRPSEALAGVPDGSYVYFTHSYAAPVGEDCVAAATHGTRFAAVVERGNVWGVQFHPEKSGDIGLALLRNFARLSR